MLDVPPPRVVEGRRSPRKRTLLGGKVIYGDDNRVRDCTIRDISQKGARIALAQGEIIPTSVFLLDRRNATVHEAKVTWIKAPNFGLRFVNSYSLDSELPPELQHIKRIWTVYRSPLGTID
ncbi:MAG TPA: PilZ domain-containing protein [Micropepsaceae bacterium]|nr:PilZ domain-containing protein [Micropepsaceae bacterium]